MKKILKTLSVILVLLLLSFFTNSEIIWASAESEG